MDRNASIVDDLPELADTYDERGFLDEIEFQDTDLPPWPEDWSAKSKANESDNHEATRSTAVEDQATFHEDLGGLLSRLFQRLRNASAAEGRDILKELNFVNGTSEDPCQKWLNSRDKLEKVFLGRRASDKRRLGSIVCRCSTKSVIPVLQVVSPRCPPVLANTPAISFTTTKFGTTGRRSISGGGT